MHAGGLEVSPAERGGVGPIHVSEFSVKYYWYTILVQTILHQKANCVWLIVAYCFLSLLLFFWGGGGGEVILGLIWGEGDVIFLRSFAVAAGVLGAIGVHDGRTPNLL